MRRSGRNSVHSKVSDPVDIEGTNSAMASPIKDLLRARASLCLIDDGARKRDGQV